MVAHLVGMLPVDAPHDVVGLGPVLGDPVAVLSYSFTCPLPVHVPAFPNLIRIMLESLLIYIKALRYLLLLVFSVTLVTLPTVALVAEPHGCSPRSRVGHCAAAFVVLFAFVLAMVIRSGLID